MANPEHVKIVKQGKDAISNWNSRHPNLALNLKGADLSHLELGGVDLRGANLEDAILYKAQMAEAKLEGANLFLASLSRCDLTQANLNRSHLMAADLTGTDLFDAQVIDADLDNAILNGAVLMGCDLIGSYLAGTLFSGVVFEATDLSDTTIGYTVFADCDLRGVIGLETIIHEYPSTIGIDTILRSEGDIPSEFLRGCGLPDHVIEYVKSLSQKPIQYYTCFLSHSSYDEPFAKHLFDKLQGAGVRCWYFPESARTGEKLGDEIDRAIRLHDKLVIICSVHSLESKPVIKEIEKGLKREQAEALRRLQDQERVAKGKLSAEEFAKRRYHTRVLFPITIDDYVFEGWQHPLKFELQKNRVIGDFRGWKDFNSFDKAFRKLLCDLNARE
ncbi:MAG: toll/interleukin-1 receptor domain-containing protein [bacterium]|nr:toll/interleukin-1 receptor domain-containing protein [bacterium]